MDFNLTDDRRMLADTLSRFIQDQYTIESRNEAANSAIGYSQDLWSQYAELGVIGALFDEENGGFGGKGFDLAVVFENLGRGLVCEPFLDNAILAGGTLAAAGNDAQKAIIEDIIAGSKTATFAHFEPRSRYSLQKVETTAVATDDGWTLNGAKAVVRFIDTADYVIVSARTPNGVNDKDGISLFLLDTASVNLNVNSYNTVAGGRAGEVTLNNLTVSKDALIGEVGQAHDVLEKVVGAGIVALCAEALGVMEAAKEQTVDYIQTRKQFGVPIGKFQALQHRMADILIEIEQVRSAVINAAAALEKEDRVERERALSAAKYTVGHVGQKIAEETIQIHGGIGMAWELPLGHYAKRLVMIDHELGDEDYHLGRYISLGKTLSPTPDQ